MTAFSDAMERAIVARGKDAERWAAEGALAAGASLERASTIGAETGRATITRLKTKVAEVQEVGAVRRTLLALAKPDGCEGAPPPITWSGCFRLPPYPDTCATEDEARTMEVARAVFQLRQ
jgi:hypothetical protein